MQKLASIVSFGFYRVLICRFLCNLLISRFVLTFRINTYIETGRGHGPVETPKGKVVRVSGDGPLRGAGAIGFCSSGRGSRFVRDET